MKKATQIGATVAIGLSLIARASAPAQPVVPPPSPPDRAAVGALVERLGVRVRGLADDVRASLGKTPAGRVLAQDAQELAQAIGEFQAVVAAQRGRFEMRRAYSGIDASWQHYQAELARTDGLTPAVRRDLAQVGEMDRKIGEALGLNAYPANYYGPGPAPEGLSEVRRLTQALVDRGEAVASVIRAELPGVEGNLPYSAAVSLVKVADAFHDAIDLNARIDIARNGFAGVAAETKQLEDILARGPNIPRIREAFRSYKSVEVLLRKALGLPMRQEDQVGTALPANGPSPVPELANQLVAQVGSFIEAFRPTAAVVPEGGLILADIERLLTDANDFRNDAARGLPPGQLAFEFRNVDIDWQRLARRTNRIARGRVGPNIQRVEQIGRTCASLHQLLGLPGYPPVVGPVAPPP